MINNKCKIKVIAFYLPQFHPIPENDSWWGKGFTEWTNVTKAKPLFPGHEQPKLPGDFGFYDLRIKEAWLEQAKIAKEYGVSGFCYWHYWFGNGKRLLEKPINDMMQSKEYDFPFCLGWANESWKGFPHGIKNRNTLIEQQYLGIEDYKQHFYDMLPALIDPRYIKIDDKPVFLIYRPFATQEITIFIEEWRKLAKDNGIGNIYFIGHVNEPNIKIDDVLKLGFDAVNTVRLNDYFLYDNFYSKMLRKLLKTLFHWPTIIDYKKASKYFINSNFDSLENVFPSIIPNWDHTPRSGSDGLVLHKSSPDKFEKHVEEVLELVSKKNDVKRIVFLKSWNEWAEGNMVEPDRKWGYCYLEKLKNCLDRVNQNEDN